jgi:hypothetical protein
VIAGSGPEGRMSGSRRVLVAPAVLSLAVLVAAVASSLGGADASGVTQAEANNRDLAQVELVCASGLSAGGTPDYFGDVVTKDTPEDLAGRYYAAIRPTGVDPALPAPTWTIAYNSTSVSTASRAQAVYAQNPERPLSVLRMERLDPGGWILSSTNDCG